jgi:membrane-associated PAP2 superfamily phosphatase
MFNFSHSVRFYSLHLLLPLLLGAVLLWLYPLTNLDLALIQPYYNSIARNFFLKDNLILDGVMHTGLKSALWLIPIALVAILIWSYTNLELKIHRRRIVWLLVGLAISPLIVQALKRNSIHACPWDLQIFGGYAPLLPLFGHLPAGVEPGRCFPGGHASGGFSLLAFYFGLRDGYRKLANLCLWGALILGNVMGWAQMMRGAHFMSHNLWTMWWSWMGLLILYCLWSPVANANAADVAVQPKERLA